jgi:hypothetical protein
MRKMYYQYGLYKPLVNKKLGAPATVRQFFPLLFLLGLIIGGICSIFSTFILHTYTTLLMLYLFIGIVVGSMGAIRAHQPLLALLMPYVFFNIHMSYGVGYIVGIFNVIGNKSAQVKPNR